MSVSDIGRRHFQSVSRSLSLPPLSLSVSLSLSLPPLSCFSVSLSLSLPPLSLSLSLAHDSSPAFDVWSTNKDLSIKSTGSQERWIENVNAIGGSQDNNIRLLSKPYKQPTKQPEQ